MSDQTIAEKLTAADLGRPITYTYKGTDYRLRLDAPKVVTHGEHRFVRLANGHDVHPGMPITLLPDDRVHEPGLYPDMDEDVYHGDPLRHLGGSLSASMCKVLIQPGGEAKLRWRLDNPQPRKAVFEFGKAAHSLVLGSGAEFVAIEGHRGNREVKAKIAEAEADGKIVLKPDEYNQVHGMADALAKSATAMDLLSKIRPEVSAFRKGETGTWLRARFDGLADDYIVDYKTAQSADGETFSRAAFKFAYQLQAAAYLDMARALTGRDRSFYFIVQEKTAPYLPSVLEMSRDYLTAGREEYHRAIETWDRCQRTGEWPGYPDEIQTILPPVWASEDDEMEVA